MREFRGSKSGGKFSDGITDFEWGNVETLLAEKLHSSARVARVTDASSWRREGLGWASQYCDRENPARHQSLSDARDELE